MSHRITADAVIHFARISLRSGLGAIPSSVATTHEDEAHAQKNRACNDGQSGIHASVSDHRLVLRLGGCSRGRLGGQLSHPPLFVAMTAFDTDETILKCLSLGAAGYIAKGQDPESIIRSLSEKSPSGTILSPESTTRLIKRSILRPKAAIPHSRCPQSREQ